MMDNSNSPGTQNISSTAQLYKRLYPNSDIPTRILLKFFMRGTYPKTSSYRELLDAAAAR